MRWDFQPKRLLGFKQVKDDEKFVFVPEAYFTPKNIWRLSVYIELSKTLIKRRPLISQLQWGCGHDCRCRTCGYFGRFRIISAVRNSDIRNRWTSIANRPWRRRNCWRSGRNWRVRCGWWGIAIRNHRCRIWPGLDRIATGQLIQI